MRALIARCSSMLALLLVGLPVVARAQGAFVGAGLGATTVPRSLYALCASERRMSGASVSALAGYRAGRLRWVTSLDATHRGYGDAADCIARSGTAVDSVFAAGSSTVVTTSADVWYAAVERIDVGAGAGRVPGHGSWFVSLRRHTRPKGAPGASGTQASLILRRRHARVRQRHHAGDQPDASE